MIIVDDSRHRSVLDTPPRRLRRRRPVAGSRSQEASAAADRRADGAEAAVPPSEAPEISETSRPMARSNPAPVVRLYDATYDGLIPSTYSLHGESIQTFVIPHVYRSDDDIYRYNQGNPSSHQTFPMLCNISHLLIQAASYFPRGRFRWFLDLQSIQGLRELSVHMPAFMSSLRQPHIP